MKQKHFSVVQQQNPFGWCQLQMNIKEMFEGIKKNENFDITVQYSTTYQAKAITFINDTVSGKQIPYFYTVCKPVYCRSIAPLQVNSLSQLFFIFIIFSHL